MCYRDYGHFMEFIRNMLMDDIITIYKSYLEVDPSPAIKIIELIAHVQDKDKLSEIATRIQEILNNSQHNKAYKALEVDKNVINASIELIRYKLRKGLAGIEYEGIGYIEYRDVLEEKCALLTQNLIRQSLDKHYKGFSEKVEENDQSFSTSIPWSQ